MWVHGKPSRFWMVQGSGTARFRHESRAQAEAEATRLALSNPGETFFVMEAVAAVRRQDVEYTSLRPNDEETPF